MSFQVSSPNIHNYSRLDPQSYILPLIERHSRYRQNWAVDCTEMNLNTILLDHIPAKKNFFLNCLHFYFLMNLSCFILRLQLWPFWISSGKGCFNCHCLPLYVLFIIKGFSWPCLHIILRQVILTNNCVHSLHIMLNITLPPNQYCIMVQHFYTN